MQKKLNWLTNLKVLGILAVILGHINSPFREFIFSWHMPLFFIVAGFFIKFDLNIKAFIIRDFKRLMVPYFIFSFVGLFADILKRILLDRDQVNIINELKAIFVWMDISSLINTYAFVLWFLPTLFFARIILYYIHNYISNVVMQILLVFVIFSLSFILDLPLALDNAFNALLFVFIGNRYFLDYTMDNKLLYMLILLVLIIFVFYGFPSLDMSFKNYGNVFINIIFAVSMIYTFILILKKVNIKGKLLDIWGSNTMLLFIIHPYTNNIAHIIVKKIDFGDWYLKFFISLVLLQIILFTKQRFENKGVFKYV